MTTENIMSKYINTKRMKTKELKRFIYAFLMFEFGVAKAFHNEETGYTVKLSDRLFEDSMIGLKEYFTDTGYGIYDDLNKRQRTAVACQCLTELERRETLAERRHNVVSIGEIARHSQTRGKSEKPKRVHENPVWEAMKAS